MIEIPAKTVFVDPGIRERPNSLARLERVLPNIRCGDVRELGPGGLAEVRAGGKRRHGKDDFGDDAIVAFTTWEPGLEGWYYHLREAERVFERQCGYCQTAVELNLVEGCPFRCAYCGFGRFIIFALDVERLVAGLDDVFSRLPGQTLYKFSNMTDLPPFEPELDAVAPMVRRFAREPERYLMLFTKSDNVDFLTDLDHRRHTIVSWSLAPETQTQLVDKRTPDTAARLAAMREVERAGYTVRARLSPIVPVSGWREEYRDLLARLFEACRPDVVTLELLGWFDYDDLVRTIDPALLDPETLAAAERSAETLRGRGSGPFTEKAHQDVYRYLIEAAKSISPETPVAVCHGTPQTWRALGGRMGMTPDDYICNCGATSAPGGAHYPEWVR
jgi:hypothetical protein